MKVWKKILIIILVVTILAGAVGVGGYYFYRKNKTGAANKKGEEYDPAELAEANLVTLEEGFTDVAVITEESALETVNMFSSSLGMNNPKASLKVSSVDSFDGETYYRLQQYFDGVPVLDREVVLITNEAGRCLQLSSNIVKVDANTVVGSKKSPNSINYPQLLKKAETLLKNNKLAFLDFKCTAQPEMVYFSEDGVSLRSCFEDVITFKDANGKQYAYKILFDCDNYEPVIVDDMQTSLGRNVTASGLDRENQTRRFTAYYEDNKYWMIDSERNIAVYNANNNTVGRIPMVTDGNDNHYYYINGELYDEDNNVVFFSDDETSIVDGNGNVLGTDLSYGLYCYTYPDETALEVASSDSRQWNDTNAVSAVSRTQNVYDFYKNVLGRDSYNDRGGAIRIYYNDENDGDVTNAYSCDMPDMTMLSFGSQNDIAFDCVGHEYTHSVLGSIVDLPYRNQTGALNEAYADIFGEIAEDYADGTLDNSCNWATDIYRDHVDPLADGYPVEYKGRYWARNISIPDFLANTPLRIINSITDNGGVHTNSTIISHAAYLMNTGIDGDESKKIGTEMLAKIFYKSMFSFHSDETFRQCSQHVYEAAERTEGITPAQLSCVKEAFAMANLEVQ